MKKYITLLLSALLCSSVLIGCNNPKEPPIDSAIESHTDNGTEKFQANYESDFRYEENETGGITITRYIGSNSTVIIPEFIQAKPVTRIGMEAFRLNVAISVKMSDKVTAIEGGAFLDCDKLEEIILSNTITEIDAHAFEGCTSLKHIRIPSTVRILGEMVFHKSGLESIDFEEGIEVIPSYAFAATNLINLILPKSIKEFGFQAFAGCMSLESITLNEGLVSIGHKAFVNDPKLKEIIIPKTVENVTEMAFSMCSGLEKVMFEGDAPRAYQYSDPISGVWEPTDVHYTIYYHESAKGFTSPEWNGYPTQIW